MTQEHPITPPYELVLQWCKERACISEPGPVHLWLATQAARWGADQELQACCAGIHTLYGKCGADFLRVSRRPKPPTLKERGREALQNIHNAIVMETGGRELDVLKEIVESLPD